jgi:organic hydroperoxide reductase OsmC/OhrA
VLYAVRMAHAHDFSCKTVWRGSTSTIDYPRAHDVFVPGKPALRASASPAFRGDAAIHNPEDLLVAALSSCHMLSYLAFAARSRLVVEAYEDDATGVMDDGDGTMRFRRVELRPRVTVAPGSDLALARSLHERAHHACFIASSVNFEVANTPTIVEREHPGPGGTK